MPRHAAQLAPCVSDEINDGKDREPVAEELLPQGVFLGETDTDDVVSQIHRPLPQRGNFIGAWAS